MNTIDTLKVKERLQQLRIKWSKAKEAEDEVMMNVIERMAKSLKRSIGDES